MNINFLIYQKRQELWSLLLTNWQTDITTIKLWGMVAVIVLAYVVWYRLTDKTRLANLILYGALVTIIRELVDLFGVTMGLWFYKIGILPLSPSILLQDWTIIPLTFMLVQQYSLGWRKFFICNAVGAGIWAGVILPVLVYFNILVFVRWNYLYAFALMYLGTTIARIAFHLIIQVQEKAREDKSSPLKNTLMQPAFKPLPNKESEDEYR